MIEIFGRLLADRREMTERTRIVEGNIQSAERLQRALDERLNFFGDRHIGCDRETLTALGLDPRDGCLEFWRAAASHDDFRARACIGKSGCLPNSAAAAGDERNTPVEPGSLMYLNICWSHLLLSRVRRVGV